LPEKEREGFLLRTAQVILLRRNIMIGSTEMIIIALVVMVLFGASAIPKFAKSLGKAKKEFEKGVKEGQEEPSNNKNENEKEKK
jgi:sec-independent protein translocase protein TatA